MIRSHLGYFVSLILIDNFRLLSEANKHSRGPLRLFWHCLMNANFDIVI